MIVGILALQGSFVEHEQMLSHFPGHSVVLVKTQQALKTVDCLILPGGESTTLQKLLLSFNMLDLLRQRIEQGMPVWGTCAGMILLAKQVSGQSNVLGQMDITVLRNAFGTQSDSFIVHEVVPSVSPLPIPLVFIRAPWIERVDGTTQILHTLDGKIVAARQNHMLVTSFHPELTNNTSFHAYFLKMSQSYLKVNKH